MFYDCINMNEFQFLYYFYSSFLFNLFNFTSKYLFDLSINMNDSYWVTYSLFYFLGTVIITYYNSDHSLCNRSYNAKKKINKIFLLKKNQAIKEYLHSCTQIYAMTTKRNGNLLNAVPLKTWTFDCCQHQYARTQIHNKLNKNKKTWTHIQFKLESFKKFNIVENKTTKLSKKATAAASSSQQANKMRKNKTIFFFCFWVVGLLYFFVSLFYFDQFLNPTITAQKQKWMLSCFFGKKQRKYIN